MSSVHQNPYILTTSTAYYSGQLAIIFHKLLQWPPNCPSCSALPPHGLFSILLPVILLKSRSHHILQQLKALQWLLIFHSWPVRYSMIWLPSISLTSSPMIFLLAHSILSTLASSLPSNTPNMYPPQDFSICYSFCLECSFPLVISKAWSLSSNVTLLDTILYKTVTPTQHQVAFLPNFALVFSIALITIWYIWYTIYLFNYLCPFKCKVPWRQGLYISSAPRTSTCHV